MSVCLCSHDKKSNKDTLNNKKGDRLELKWKNIQNENYKKFHQPERERECYAYSEYFFTTVQIAKPN